MVFYLVVFSLFFIVYLFDKVQNYCTVFTSHNLYVSIPEINFRQVISSIFYSQVFYSKSSNLLFPL